LGYEKLARAAVRREREIPGGGGEIDCCVDWWVKMSKELC